ncbi:hypothetical protein [Legionella shakespearei]|uniref:Uncharacterized protein n=1 Tax=Legionella shakespearei DSM 23087 TaxID=1122169 RepID=A0A0W0YVJ2_9GAMM|nr:hypothetical protein [Legionella shakespearei]KTD60887.1 hypothetical protein Lsha_1408 [Legionella shakespearei DSM 23087]
MILKKFSSLIILLITSPLVQATPPVEVISSCKSGKADRPLVTFTQLEGPYAAAQETDCDDHIETTEAGITYGGISCGTTSYLIINSTRLDLNNAENYSVNPSIKPKHKIPYTAHWSKIEFNSNAYLCLEMSLSDSGVGAGISQYYIVENAYNLNPPTVYFYFFDKDIMPVSSL